MGKKIKYRVEHDGIEFTRQSARVYTHAVVSPVSLAAALARAEESAGYDWKTNRAYHQAYVNGTSEFLGPDPWHKTEEHRAQKAAQDAEHIDYAKAWLAGGLDGLIARAKVRAEQYWRKQHGDRNESWVCAGWCGRLDLAQKLADPGDVILEAQQR